MLNKSVLALALGVALCGTSLASNNNNNVEDNAAPRVQASNPFNYSEANLKLLLNHSEMKFYAPGEKTEMKLSEEFKTLNRMIFNQEVDTNFAKVVKLISTVSAEERNLLPGTLTVVRMIQRNEFNTKKADLEKNIADLKGISYQSKTGNKITDIMEQLEKFKDLERFANHIRVTEQLYDIAFKAIYRKSESEYVADLVSKAKNGTNKSSQQDGYSSSDESNSNSGDERDSTSSVE